MIDVNAYVKVLTEKKINSEEFLFLYFLYLVQHVDNSYYKIMKLYTDVHGIEEGGKLRTTSSRIKQSLAERGFITIKGTGETVSDYKLTDKFLDEFVDVYEHGTEMYDSYPAFTIIKGNNIPLKTLDRETARKEYSEKIRFSKIEHQEVLKDIKYATENQLINMSIKNFLAAESWKDWRKLRTLNQSNISNSTKLMQSNEF